MSSTSPHNQQPDQYSHQNPPQQQPLDSQTKPLSDLLSQILASSQETSPEHTPELPEINLLRETARRYIGQPLQLQPHITELLQSILKPVRGMSADNYAVMIRQVAQTMWDDTESQRRLMQLWASLQRSVSHDC
jgi:hypothetical protein